MKRIRIKLFGIILFLFGFLFYSRAQSGKLSVIGWNLPDTLNMGDTVSVSITIQNTGAGPINDPFFYLYYSTDWIGFSPTLLDTVFLSNPLNPGDTIINISSLHIISSTFQPGDNIVIVWPYRISGEQGDTLQDTVYVIDNPTNLLLNEIHTMKYRISEREIQVKTRIPLKQCELINLEGKAISLPTYYQNDGHYLIKIPVNLSQTFYFLRLTFQDETPLFIPIHLRFP